MVTDRTERADDETETETETEGGDGAAQPAPSGPLSPRTGQVTFSPEQHEYMGRKIADERKATLEKFKSSDDYKNLVSRARRTDQVEGESRQKLETLENENAKLRAERAQALSKAEAALARAQMSAILSQRGVPADRVQDAMILADTTGLKVDLEQGVVSGAEESVQALIEAKPWLVGPGFAPRETQAPRPVPNLNGGAQGSPTGDEARVAEAMKQMAQRGLGRI